jgi:hypothetical protein
VTFVFLTIAIAARRTISWTGDNGGTGGKSPRTGDAAKNWYSRSPRRYFNVSQLSFLTSVCSVSSCSNSGCGI